MSGFVLVVLFFNICTIFTIHTARILAYFPTPSISHQVVFRALTQELVQRGHDIVVVTTDPAFPKGETPENITEIDVHDVSYETWREYVLPTTSEKKNDLITQVTVMLNVIIEVCKQQLLTDEMQELIKYKSDHFDLLLLETWVTPGLALSHVFKAPVILISSFGSLPGNYELVGAPENPLLLYPSMIRQRLYDLTLKDKMKEIYLHCNLKYLFWDYDKKADALLKELFGTDIPTVHELSNNVHMMFYNIHPIWEGNRPVPPSVIYMGGIHQKPLRELPQELKSYLDSSVSGVIYISFGTNVDSSMLPPEKIQAMVKVFSQMPYDILWKWDKDELPGKSRNIKISRWLPQSDLLRHPKVKLFITQGGLQSTDEAITAGIPLIGMPMLGDQWHNVEKYPHHKIGLKYSIETLTEQSFTTAINTVIEDKSYRRNVAKLRALMQDQPQRPLERAVWWTEHVLRHGGARHLRAPAANMSWSQYLDLELVLTLLTICLLVLAVFSFVIILLMSFVKNLFILSDGNLKKSQ